MVAKTVCPALTRNDERRRGAFQALNVPVGAVRGGDGFSAFDPSRDAAPLCVYDSATLEPTYYVGTPPSLGMGGLYFDRVEIGGNVAAALVSRTCKGIPCGFALLSGGRGAIELGPSMVISWPRGLAVRDDGRVFLAFPNGSSKSRLTASGETKVFEVEEGKLVERFRLTASGALMDIVADAAHGFYLLYVSGEGPLTVSTVVALDPTYAERARWSPPVGIELTDLFLRDWVTVGGNVYGDDGGGSHTWVTARDSGLGSGGRPYPPFIGREGTLSSIQFTSTPAFLLAGANGNDGWVQRIRQSAMPPGDLLEVPDSDRLSAMQQSDGTILVINGGLFQRWTP